MNLALMMFAPTSLALLLLTAAALTLATVLTIAVRSALQVGAENICDIQPLDLDAFRNLTDPAENEYLRQKLSAGDYRSVQRLRLKAMAAYVRIAGQNAALLVRLGASAAQSSDLETASAARELMDSALLLRRNAAFALCRIYAAWLWPNAHFTASSVLDGYRQMSGSAMLLGRLQNPATPVRIAVS
jgi:hypothetical protein